MRIPSLWQHETRREKERGQNIARERIKRELVKGISVERVEGKERKGSGCKEGHVENEKL